MSDARSDLARGKYYSGENFSPKLTTKFTDLDVEEVTVHYECKCGFHEQKKKMPPFMVRDRDCPQCGKLIIPYFKLEETKNGKNE